MEDDMSYRKSLFADEALAKLIEMARADPGNQEIREVLETMTDVEDTQKAPKGQQTFGIDITQITGPNVSLKEWARIVDVKLSFAYELSRHNRIEGMFRVGKFVRVHLPTFYAAKGIEPWNDTAEELTE